MSNVGAIWHDLLASSPNEGLLGHELDFFDTFVQSALTADRILEIGVGTGRMVRVLRGHGVGAEFVGVDLHDLCGGNGVRLALADTRRLPFPDNEFDLTYSLGVVEHMSPPETALALQEHARVTRPGGHIFITTPARSVLFTPLRKAVHAFKFRKHGSFTEVLGRNLEEGEVLTALAGLRILRMGRSGAYVPRGSASLRRKAASLTPASLRAYLWVLVEKPE